MPENKIINNIPSQNTGIDTPIKAVVIVKLSIREFFLTAEITPKITPTIDAMMMAKTASSIVAGRRAMISVVTGVLVKNEVPKSPLNIATM